MYERDRFDDRYAGPPREERYREDRFRDERYMMRNHPRDYRDEPIRSTEKYEERPVHRYRDDQPSRDHRGW